MRHAAHAQRRGFSLTELVVVTAILSATMVMVAQFFSQLSDFWETVGYQSDLRTTTQRAMDEVAVDLRNATRTGAGSPPNIAMLSPSSLRLYLPTDTDGNGVIIDVNGNTEWDAANPVVIQYDAAAQQLLRVQGATTRIIANDVSSVTFQDQAADPTLYVNEIRINLALQQTTLRQRTITVASTAVVRLRN